ncbi:hypothetical protein N0V83_001460 [Neocucurbitaria cava]|uniref:Uncharacterized protein n=1 Tax=Neocucurbitaria cava TaxID=798079 RepID=A0A9W9CR95_9PLEO|nr:hypothetical protein N0V83_001460 [Neocucurbitaria cava]
MSTILFNRTRRSPTEKKRVTMTMNEIEEKLASLDLRSCQDKFIIDLTSPPSSPSTEEFGYESESEDEEEATAELSIKMGQSLPSTSMVQMVSHLLTALKVTREQESIIAAECAIIEYLHVNAATLADVEALIPAMNSNTRIMGKLATNIGWHRSRGTISNAETEQILAHILTNGDLEGAMFERTKKCIKRNESPHGQRIAMMQADEYDNQAAWEAERRWKTMPRQLRVRQEHELLPAGCTCLADVYAYIYCMTWSGVLALNKIKRASTKKKLKVTVARNNPPKTVFDGTGSGSFSQTRLHNGPGLTDKRKPKVILPRAVERPILTTPEKLNTVKSATISPNQLWAKTMPSPGYYPRAGKRMIMWL